MPATFSGTRIHVWAPILGDAGSEPPDVRPRWIMFVIIAGTALLLWPGCAERNPTADQERTVVLPARVLVVAPVVNLSNTSVIDPLKVTDIVASELATFQGVNVIPVNLALAALMQRGKLRVETPQDALDLAREFNADGTIVAAVTELDPYDPPRAGIVMQWYASDPVLARPAPPGDVQPAGFDGGGAPGPRLQVQRVFSAADERTLEDVRKYGRERDGDRSPFAWRRFVVSQELFVRYCCWASIRTMLSEDAKRAGVASGSGTQE